MDWSELLAAYQDRRFDTVLEQLSQPKTAAECWLKGEALRGESRFEEAETAQRNALEQDPNHAQALLALGVTLTAQGKYDEAVEHFDAVLHRNPGFESALSARAHALQSKGDFEAAMETYHGALDVHFERVATRIIEGQGITHDDPDLFKHVMFNELKRKPFTAVVYNSIGLCYLNLGEKDGAREYFKESIRHTPNDFGFPDPAENLELLNPLKPPVPDDTRETFKQKFDIDLPIFGGTGTRQDPVVLVFEPAGAEYELVSYEHEFVRCIGKGLDFKVLNLVSSDLLTLDGRVLDRVRFEIEEVQGVEIKRLIRTWWFDITAPWHKDERYNPIVE